MKSVYFFIIIFFYNFFLCFSIFGRLVETYGWPSGELSFYFYCFKNPFGVSATRKWVWLPKLESNRITKKTIKPQLPFHPTGTRTSGGKHDNPIYPDVFCFDLVSNNHKRKTRERLSSTYPPCASLPRYCKLDFVCKLILVISVAGGVKKLSFFFFLIKVQNYFGVSIVWNIKNGDEIGQSGKTTRGNVPIF